MTIIAPTTIPTIELSLPRRRGQRPRTTAPTRERPFPHQQRDQQAPEDLQELLFQRAAALPDVTVGRSLVSLPESRAFHLDQAAVGGPTAAFQRRTEFAHIHTDNDGSLHLTLPPDLYDAVLATGWGEPHPVSAISFLGLLSPVVATIIGWVALGEQLSAVQLAGAALVGVAVAVPQLGRERPTTPLSMAPPITSDSSRWPDVQTVRPQRPRPHRSSAAG